MTNVEKLAARLLQRPSEMRASEIETILKARGWTLATRSGTSHRKWTKPGHDSIEYAVKDQMVMRTYLGKIARRLGLPEEDRR
jgi:predicted RNA binding protein YcfA (HicA-like mRNA interferase family)